MSFARRFYVLCGIFGGIATILLLFCGQKAPACTLMQPEFAPASMGKATFAPLPPQLPFSQWENRDSAVPQHAVLSRDRATPPPASGIIRSAVSLHLHGPFAFPRQPRHIPDLLEIRGMLPFSLAPPASLS